jgi:pimeloyl-ACP methyl ester carboxylesterase
MSIILISGVNPAAAKGIFDAIKKELPKEEFIELDTASEEQLLQKKPKGKFIVIGKSAGGRLALENQLKHKDASALVLLAPAAEADQKFREIKVPTLIVHGTADPVIPLENSKQMQKIIPNCKLVEIEGADHSYRGKEKEAAKAVADFLKPFQAR